MSRLVIITALPLGVSLVENWGIGRLNLARVDVRTRRRATPTVRGERLIARVDRELRAFLARIVPSASPLVLYLLDVGCLVESVEFVGRL